MSGVLYAATLVSALGCGLIAGVFFAFSSFVMPALRRLSPERGIAAMQSINVLAVTPVFMTALFGTAAACLGLVVWAVISWGEQPAALVLAGGALYIVGTIGVTIACNVPLNNRLANMHPQRYLTRQLINGILDLANGLHVRSRLLWTGCMKKSPKRSTLSTSLLGCS
jgi:uncharacterized membrane protein